MCEEYRRAVDTLFEFGSDTVIPNGRPEHAAILLGTIFKYAKKYVYLFCQNLRSDVFDNPFLFNQISRAHDRNVSIRILIGGESIESGEMRRFLDNNRSVSIQRFTGTLNPASHFAVADDCAFRMESSHENTQAVGCANRPNIATQLRDLFFEMEKQSVGLQAVGE